MALEIERKFLCNLTEEQAKELAYSSRFIQSIYIHSDEKESTRVSKSIYSDGIVNCGWNEKKSIKSSIARDENEWYLPERIFNALDTFKYPTILKKRYLIGDGDYTWEVDFFDNYGFVIAEIEFKTVKDAEAFDTLPSWIIREVTNEPFYLNCNLAKSL